jgi:DNA repair exonuclease SbcCD nuclease subunit
MRKVIALASSDWHLFNWPQFNEKRRRLKVSNQFIQFITNHARDLSVPILFPGDLFHTPQGIDNAAYEFFNPLFRQLDEENKVHIYGVGGNHDQSETNTRSHKSPSLFLGACKAFPNLFKNVEFKRLEIKRLNIMGIPYISHNVGIRDLVNEAREDIREGCHNILLIHCDLWGARDPSGYEVNTVENIPRNLGKFFRGFDIVLSGHIHKHDKIGNNIYMVGAPYQQRKSDMGCVMGYLLIYDDYSVEFKRYPGPEFKVYDKEEGHPETNDFWIPIIKSKKREKGEVVKFSTNMSKQSLAKKYLRTKGITSKVKIKALINILHKTDD